MPFFLPAGALIGVGVLIGSVGFKALKSKTAKKFYVKSVAKGLQAKSYYADIVEQAKAEVADIVAEATFINAFPEDESTEEAKEVSAAEKKAAPAKTVKAKA